MTSLARARPADDDIRRVLEGHGPDSLAPIAGLHRRLAATRTSFHLEEIDVTLQTGECIQLMFKDLSRDALIGDAAHVKPLFVYDPLREIGVYRDLLRGVPGVPRYVRSAVDVATERYWLFIERVQATELFQFGGTEQWCRVARWAGELHRRFAAETLSATATAHLLGYDVAYYRHWLERARRFTSQGDRRRTSVLDHLEQRLDALVTRALLAGCSVVHGELYGSNVLVSPNAESPRVSPVDWEMAGIGPSLLDLAALTSGGWNESERLSIVNAYREAGASDLALPTFIQSLAACQALFAVQWLGWSDDWTPPAEHRRNWIDDLEYWLDRC